MNISNRLISTAARQRAAALLKELSLEEKVRQLGCTMLVSDDTDLTAKDLSGGIGEIALLDICEEPEALAARLRDVQQYVMEHSPHRIPALFHCEALGGPVVPHTVLYPNSIGLGATFDTALVRDMANTIRTQMRAMGILHALSPVLDVAKDLRWGRVNETYGGDPTLSAAMSCAFVQGLQGDDLSTGVAATAKHFLGYSQTVGGLNLTRTQADARELREVFAKPFEAGNDFLTNGYTFPENSNASAYTFTYQTVAPDPVNGTVSATNQTTLEKGSRSYTATANVSTGVGKADIRKYRGTVTPLENGDQKVMWNITGTVPAGVNSFKIVDNIREPLYGVKTKLETAIRNNLRLTMEGGTTLTWEEAEENGIQIQLSLFSNGSNDWSDPDNGISVSDDATAVHRIRLQFSRPDGEKLRILRCTISNIPTVAKTSDMANNTTRHFVNRAEIYTDNAGNEGWRGTYDYTKIGSITKETSDTSGDGYKQNNSTTYAKNKVIWYCIKLNLGSGDVDKTHTLTVVDKIPDGMKLATDNNSLSSYRIAADLDTASGNKYTGKIKKSPSENIYSLVFGRDTYWSIDTSDPNQLTIKVLPVTLNKLIDPNKTTDHYVEIRYALQLDDAAAWNERTLEEKTYTNTATWDGASTSSGMTITRPKKELLEKKGSYNQTTHQANYTLCINPRAEDLAPGSDTLELTDTMESEYFGKTGMELMLDSIKVYEYILQDGDWVKGNEVKDSVRVEKVEETASTRKYKFILPDEKALVLEYSYKMNPGNLASDMAVTNTATLAGKIVGNQVSVKSDSATATVNNAVLTVSKTDSATNLAITASPATFAIYHYNKTDSKWESIGTWQTTNGSFDLIFAQSPAAGSSQLVIKDLYKLVETKAPTDYAPDATPHYFIWNNTATDDDKKAAALTTATGTTVLEGVTTANISFLGVNGDRTTMAIPNKQNCLTLRKIWYGIGNDTIEAPVDEIQVQLYRYKDGKDKADAETVGTPVSLTKADGWTKKISSLESGYHYYVEELGTDSGALIFYEVKYSESNDTGVTGGGTITITNKQKPSYELPATGAAGTPPYTAAGALIMGIALMLRYLINKRSHSRGGEN